ncbi:MAG: 30S ribosomal protein S12 methylthiotransferase RimO [Bacteroidia bacterium]|nr:30S ribosomal protein S12 methylthiotransferase RimO [Bacteroidia bacterium]
MRTKPYLPKNLVNVITLGCSKNLVDSEVLLNQLQANQINAVHDSAEKTPIVIINTCGFIDQAKAESIDTILAYAHEKSLGNIQKLYVIGCLSERYKDDLVQEFPEADGIFGTQSLPELLQELSAEYKQHLIGERLLTTPKHYAYLKISEGCNRPCSFCAIPLMRGAHVSRTIESLLQETESLAQKGVKELILIAQDLSFYGIDLYSKHQLANLLEQLSQISGIEWIRLQYAYPNGFPEDVLQVIRQNPKICQYLDIPLQHISDKILTSMRRGISQARTQKLIQTIREQVPDIHLRTTLIVGYPGETSQDFDELKQFVQQFRFDRLGVFKYSHEENTHAFNLLDDVPEKVKENRLQELMALQQQISFELNTQKIGKTYKVIIDRHETPYWIGRTEYDTPEVDNEVIITSSKPLKIGEFYDVLIHDCQEFDLMGSINE